MSDEKRMYLFAALLIGAAAFALWHLHRKGSAVHMAAPVAGSEVPEAIDTDSTLFNTSTPLYQSVNAPSPQGPQPPSGSQSYFSGGQLTAAISPDLTSQLENAVSVGLPETSYYGVRQE
jgi:hypothetical protein